MSHPDLYSHYNNQLSPVSPIMNLVCNCNPSSLALTTKSIVSSSYSMRHQESNKPVLPFFSPSHRQIQLSSRASGSTTAAKATASPTSPYPLCETVEHIVLFKMKPGTNLEILVDQLNLLRKIPGVLYLTAGIVDEFYCSSKDLYFDVFLHSRHANKQAVDSYMHNPTKLHFTNTYTELYYEDYMVLDWVTYHPEPLPNPKLGNALRLAFFKMNDNGWGDVYTKVGEELGPGSDQLTFGENYVGKTYRPAYKGFALSSLGVFPGVYQMKALGTPQDFGTKLLGQLEPTVNEVIVIDCIIKVV